MGKEILIVHLLEGRNLAAADSNGLSDPYCKIKISGERKKSKVIKKTLNPVWNETFEFKLNVLPQQIIIECYDKDLATSDFIGQITISSLKTTLQSGSIDQWFPLMPSSSKNSPVKISGEIHLKVIHSNSSGVSDPTPPTISTTPSPSTSASSTPTTPHSSRTNSSSSLSSTTSASSQSVESSSTPRSKEKEVETGKKSPSLSIRRKKDSEKDKKEKDSHKDKKKERQSSTQKLAGLLQVGKKSKKSKKDSDSKTISQDSEEAESVSNTSHSTHGGSDTEQDAAAPPSEHSASSSSTSLPTITNSEPDSRRSLADEPSGYAIAVISARNLPNKDVTGLSDPYVKVKYGNDQRGKTKTIQDTLNPTWNERFKFARETSDTIEIQVWDEDAGADSFIGELQLNVVKENANNALAHERWFPLLPKQKKKGNKSQTEHLGEILLAVENLYVPVEKASKGKVVSRPIEDALMFVEVIKAKNLPAADANGLSDPYCKVKFGDYHYFRTTVVQRNLHPVWKERFSFGVPSHPTESLLISVWDDDMTSDDFLGQVEFSPAQYMSGKIIREWFPLQKKAQKAQSSSSLGGTAASTQPQSAPGALAASALGHIHLEIIYVPKNKPVPMPPILPVGALTISPIEISDFPKLGACYATIGFENHSVKLSTHVKGEAARWGESLTIFTNNMEPEISISLFEKNTPSDVLIGQWSASKWNSMFTEKQEQPLVTEDDEEKPEGSPKTFFVHSFQNWVDLKTKKERRALWLDLKYVDRYTNKEYESSKLDLHAKEDSHEKGKEKQVEHEKEKELILEPEQSEHGAEETELLDSERETLDTSDVGELLVDEEEQLDEASRPLFSRTMIVPEAQTAIKYKVVMVGDSGVGKTNLFLRYQKGVFVQSCAPTIGTDFTTKYYSLPSKTSAEHQIVKVELWDTAGQERYRNLVTTYFRNAMGGILVYDVTRVSSFKNLTAWLDLLKTYAASSSSAPFVVMVVGNKIDLKPRAVPTAVAQSWAQNQGFLYCETSAFTAENIDRAFQTILSEVHSKAHVPAPSNHVDVQAPSQSPKPAETCWC